MDAKIEDPEMITIEQQNYLKERLLIDIEKEIIEGEELLQQKRPMVKRAGRGQIRARRSQSDANYCSNGDRQQSFNPEEF